MNIVYKNLSVDFTSENSEMSGASQMTVSAEIVTRFWGDHEDTSYGNEVKEWLTENEDLDEDEKDYEFNFYNTDLQILMFSWMFKQKDENFSCEYWGDSLFWLYHDFNHAQNDVFGNEIYVDQHIEEQRIFDALNELNERNQLGIFTAQMLDTIEAEFQTRWKHQIDRERIEEMCGFVEEYEYEDEDEY